MILSARIAAVEFGEDEVRLAVVKTGGRLPTVLERHSERIVYGEPAERRDACVLALRAILERVKQKPAASVLCASARQAIVRTISVPFKGSRRVGAAVRFELEPYLAFPIDDLVVDHSVVREVDGATQVLAVGLRRATLEEELGYVTEAGLDVEGIELDGSGLTALWQASRSATPGLHAILHVREHGSVLAVVWKKTLAYMRHLPVTVAQMHENPAAAARDVQNSLRAFQVAWEGSDELSGLSITGVTFFEEERQLFEDNFRVPVSYDDLSVKTKGAAPSDESATEGNRWEVLAGVALAAAGDFPYAYNFRQGELAQANTLGTMLRHAAFSVVIGTIALLGYGVYMYLDYSDNTEKVTQAGGEIWQIFTETFPGSSRAQDGRPPTDRGGEMVFAFINEELEKSNMNSKGLSVDLFQRPTPLDILAEVARVMPGEKATLTRFEFQPNIKDDTLRITISGVAESPEVFNQIFAALNESKVLRVDADPTRESEGNKLKFTINATLQGNDSAQT